MSSAVAAQRLVSVVFSFRNEEKNLDELLSRVLAVFDSAPERLELVFVNDDSTDRSLEILKAARKTNKNIKILTTSRRFGVYECLRACFDHASGDVVVYLDADLQDPPELISEMLEQWRNGADVVHTKRLKRHGESWFRRKLTWLAYKFINFVSDIEIAEEVGDFKLISRRALNELLRMNEYDPYFRGQAVWVGFNQVTIPYERESRSRGRSRRSALSKASLLVLLSGLTSFSIFPISLFFVIGGIFCAFGIGGLLVGLADYLTAEPVSSTFWLVVLFLFGIGVTNMAISTVGYYVGRTLNETRGCPKYIIKESIGFDGQV